MKQLLAGIVLVILIAIGAFLYRSVEERPVALAPMRGAAQACTQEAKVCPDGSSVGRTGPDCAFAACALPNVENASLGIAYAVPAGFTANTTAISVDSSIIAEYDSLAASSSQPDSITIHEFPIPAGKTADDMIIENSVHEASGLPAKSLSEFTPVTTNGKTYQSITVERFEGTVHTEYYLARANDVLRFDVFEHNVQSWNDPKLLVANLPAHQALLKMLSSLQATK